MKPARIPTKPRRPPNKPRDPVEVYCRLRPLRDEEDESCAEVVSETTLQLTPPGCSLAFKNHGHKNPTRHVFKHIFNSEATQKEIFDDIAFPLVEDLVLGKNGLLFAYGVTNSGKTYTMAGEPGEPGVLPRTLDVLFNSIRDVQTPKYVFRPDRIHGFNIFTEVEARSEQQRLKPKKTSPREKFEKLSMNMFPHVLDSRCVNGVDEDSGYSVFVSYIEIYNNFVYDLLDEPVMDGMHIKPPQSKLMREDSSHQMYVSGVTEVEVKTTEEAFQVLEQGKRHRRVAQTQLNHESSRSHSVFTIRLVQAPLDPCGAEVIQDKTKVTVSQLSLVDLAGSERTSRTGTGGDRVREAGNINQSLMVLRTCIETLRDNQLNRSSKIVPYRDSKLTHLFKNHFEGEGKIRMIICVSPCSIDYDESIHVMRFAEVTQEVTVDRPLTSRVNVVGLAPGRRRANMLYRAALKEAATVNAVAVELKVPPPHPYQLALGVISVEKYLTDDCSASDLAELKFNLEKRMQTRQQLLEDLRKKHGDFRSKLVSQEEELASLRAMVSDYQTQMALRERAHRDAQRMKGVITSQERQIAQLSGQVDELRHSVEDKEQEVFRVSEQLMKSQEECASLHLQLKEFKGSNRRLEARLNHQAQENQAHVQQKVELERKVQGFVSKSKEKFEHLSREMEKKSQECRRKDEKLRQVHEVIRHSPLVRATPLSSIAEQAGVEDCYSERNFHKAHRGDKENKDTAPVVSKPSRKRSFSENWLEHKPSNTVDNGDLLQPHIKKKKTVVNPKPKHLTSKQADRYVLKHQEQNSDGEVMTELYKGSILPTRGGGASVQFTDVEKLKHATPFRAHRVTRSMAKRKRSISTSVLSDSSSQDWTDTETRCSVGIEGKPGTTPSYTHIALKNKK